MPLPAPPRTSTLLSSRVTCSNVACSSVSRSTSAALARASAEMSRAGRCLPCRISTIRSTSPGLGGRLSVSCMTTTSCSRLARSAMSPVPCTAQRGQSGIEKSSWSSVLGNATECAHRMRRRDELLHRGSVSTYLRMAYFVARAWSTGSNLRLLLPDWRHLPSTTPTLPPLTSITTTPAPPMIATMSASWSFDSSLSRRLAINTSSDPRSVRRTSQTSRSVAVSNFGCSGINRGPISWPPIRSARSHLHARPRTSLRCRTPCRRRASTPAPTTRPRPRRREAAAPRGRAHRAT